MMDYKQAGVDVEAGREFVDNIRNLVVSTHRPEVLGGLGGFSGLFALPSGYKEPVLVSGTDGVGTKLKLANTLNCHHTVGIDLVAMCVNDVLTSGAEPLFFLDYLATGKLNQQQLTEVVSGIAQGCRLAGCALIGGETAEMPGFYDENHFDLAGFAVGAVERKNLLPKEVKVNDDIIGLKSSGVHSNGFSLVRKILDVSKTQLDSNTPFNEFTFSEELLKPTRIYVKTIISLLNKTNAINAIAHITGGGITENLPRVFSSGKVRAEIYKDSWEKPEIFHWLQNAGNIEESEMLKTFNCGIGMILIVNPKETNNLLNKLKELGEEPSLIGKIIHNENPETLVVYK